MIIVGVDPGQKGGLAIMKDGACTGHPMPLAGKEVDARAVTDLLMREHEMVRDEVANQHFYVSPADNILVVVEKVHAMPKQGVSSTFKFGLNYGRILGAIEALGLRYELVTPQAWKKAILAGTDKGKTAAVEFVHRRYPSVNLMPGRMRTHHDGIADAVCLAEYGRLMK